MPPVVRSADRNVVHVRRCHRLGVRRRILPRLPVSIDDGVVGVVVGVQLARPLGADQHDAGRITIDDQDIYDPKLDVVQLRARVGMVFQKPNPFPKSIFENVAYGPRIHGLATSKSDLEQIVQSNLEKAGLWKEVKDRLNDSGTGLSGGQQQRLCIARAIAVGPEVILMDEPCSALDPIATAKVEELIDELKQNYTIVIVTHSMQQAARVSQRTAMFHLGYLVEEGATDKMFTNPDDKRTQDYITGRFG